jgi:NAD(P)-dependent dehydrogenase (short-subunit alcohol dehydrogenase family)
MTKIWLITGTSKGFGREWAEAALERGDRHRLTAPRSAQTLKRMLSTSPSTTT